MAPEAPGTLIDAILGGDDTRFGELVDPFVPAIRRVIRASVHDPATREDLVQETLGKAFTRLSTLSSPERLGAWLQQIARGCAADHHRRRAAAPWARIEESTVPEPAPSAGWIWEEVERLSPDQSEVLAMRYREGLSYREIAGRLGVPPSTVRGRIFEARRTLRARLTSPGDRR